MEKLKSILSVAGLYLFFLIYIYELLNFFSNCFIYADFCLKDFIAICQG